MTVTVLFVQGAGAYEEDAKLVASLRAALGEGYRVVYPPMPDEENPRDSAWKDAIGQAIAAIDGPLVLAAHSLGGSSLLKYLSENTLKRPILGIFSVATPFWDATNEDVAEYALAVDATLPQTIPLNLYHSRDDQDVPFAHLALYAAKFPHATLHEVETGGHQFNNDLSHMAADIRSLSNA